MILIPKIPIKILPNRIRTARSDHERSRLVRTARIRVSVVQNRIGRYSTRNQNNESVSSDISGIPSSGIRTLAAP
jgi:hypothetical protein